MNVLILSLSPVDSEGEALMEEAKEKFREDKRAERNKARFFKGGGSHSRPKRGHRKNKKRKNGRKGNT